MATSSEIVQQFQQFFKNKVHKLNNIQSKQQVQMFKEQGSNVDQFSA